MKILLKNQFNFSKISFIGLGNMGMNMATNLVKNGKHQVYGYDIDFKKQTIAQQNHITFRKDLKTIMKDANIFILMTPSSKQSKSICQSKQFGIFQHAQKGSIIIDCSTIMPDVGIQLNKKSKEHSMTYVDVPCSGGFIGAKAGTLSFMIGAENQKIFEQCKNILRPMGDKFFNCGRVGGGLMAKVCNNLALGIEMVGICEALSLGVKLGMDPKVLSDIMKVSTGRCWSIDTSNPVPGVQTDAPASHDYSHGYYTEWMIKDFNHALITAKQVNAKLQLGQTSRDMYNKILDKGARSKDFGIIYQYILNNKI